MMAGMSKSWTSCCESGQNRGKKKSWFKHVEKRRKQDGKINRKLWTVWEDKKERELNLFFHKHAKVRLYVSQSSTYLSSGTVACYPLRCQRSRGHKLPVCKPSIRKGVDTQTHMYKYVQYTHTHSLDQTVCHFISTSFPLLQINILPVSQAAL